MKIIDFARKGNLVRFFLGADDCGDYYGDDWDDCPYEHNAGPVYERYVKGYVDVVFPFDALVMEPKDDWRYSGNAPWCKDDMKARRCPCVVAVSKAAAESRWEDGCEYSFWAAADVPGVRKFYFGDPMDVPESRLILMPE